MKMTYSAKNYERLLGIPGFSDEALKSHFKLYEGYVLQVNRMMGFLKGENRATPEYEEVRRRFAWEFNGMRLHEAYFGNLSREPVELDPGSDLGQRIITDFGSLEAWERDFRATSHMRGVGWAVLAWDREGRSLFNIWVNEHDVGHLFYSTPLLVNDVFEHAYMTDYGLDRKKYVSAFLRVLDWAEVQRRFAAVVGFAIPGDYSI